MAKGKEAKGTKVTLKDARKQVRMTLPGWRRLTLSRMGITIFPKCLLKLTTVDELDLSRNLMQKLPDFFGNFVPLRWVDLHSNKLESLPEAVCNLASLIYLDLANNRLTFDGLPDAMGSLANLRVLNLGLNQLDDLPASMAGLENLQELALYDNAFVKLPDFLINLPNLAYVNVQGNPLPEDGRGTRWKGRKDDDLHVVHESDLCTPCLRKCKERRDKQMGRKGEGSGGAAEDEEPIIRTYDGLAAPNSNAAVNQDAWRIRVVEETAAAAAEGEEEAMGEEEAEGNPTEEEPAQ